jgi:predicted nuclease with TOPRIM domain
LNKLKTQREDIQSEYDRKHSECQALKENVANLNKKISNLNDNLDETKLDNLNLGQKISSLKKQIEFYRKLNAISGISVSRNGSDNSFSVRRSKGFNFEFCSQVDVLKKETSLEYTTFC